MGIAPTLTMTTMQAGSVPASPVPFAPKAALPCHVVAVGTTPEKGNAPIPVVVINDGSVPVAPVQTQNITMITYDATKVAPVTPIPIVLV